MEGLSQAWNVIKRMRARQLRRDSHGVASTVATVFSVLVFLIFLQIVAFAPIPSQRYDAEWSTSREALAAFELTRSVLSGPAEVGTSFSVPIPIGTSAVSPFVAGSPGLLTFRGSLPGPQISFRYVPDFLRSEVTRIDQDVILAIDSSGSMVWNDPNDLRVEAAKEYVDKLRCPDRIGIVDFDGDAWLTKRQKGPTYREHHLSEPGHECTPTFDEVKTDLDTIDSSGSTNFGEALRVANTEFERFGDHRHTWITILLTDGENNFAWQDTLALTESLRAAGLGVTIYTIGLYAGGAPTNLDEQLLIDIAENTGGSYYAAPTPEDIRWIYLEIANRYLSSFICSEYSTVDGTSGSLELTLAAREYPTQTLRLEGGGLSLIQFDGTELREGLPFEYLPDDPSSGSIGLTLMSFLGEDIETVGTGTEILTATVIGRDRVAQVVAKINLTEESGSVQGVENDLEDWRQQGAATGIGVVAVANHTDLAQIAILNAEANYTVGTISVAKLEVERAQIYLADAMAEVDVQVADLQIQNWLGESTKDDIRVIACRLDQWLNWYDGLTFTINSPAAAGWARWFEASLKAAGARVAVGIVGDLAVLTLHNINEYVIDHRIVEVSFGL